ncbi:MAG TPA: hypothetical protein VGI03_14610 [Verrucomicrobiae bacterium]|jgi:hypothetical protein
MAGNKRAPRRSLKPLENGQLWRVGKGNLEVTLVGKLLVHYKFGKPDAIRVPTTVNSIRAVEKFLKTSKAVLIHG